MRSLIRVVRHVGLEAINYAVGVSADDLHEYRAGRPLEAPLQLLSVGHSNHTADRFVEVLKFHGVEVVADVRSQPWSRYSSQFNKTQLKGILRSEGIEYVFLGDSLGGRPDGDEFYDDDGHVLYGRVADAPFFQDGLARLCDGARQFVVAMMCSEGSPSECHRHLLVARVLARSGVQVRHILADGTLVGEDDIGHEPCQPTLWSEGSDEWRSVRSVLPSTEQASFSESSEPPVSIG